MLFRLLYKSLFKLSLKFLDIKFVEKMRETKIGDIMSSLIVGVIMIFPLFIDFVILYYWIKYIRTLDMPGFWKFFLTGRVW